MRLAHHHYQVIGALRIEANIHLLVRQLLERRSHIGLKGGVLLILQDLQVIQASPRFMMTQSKWKSNRQFTKIRDFIQD